MSTPIEQNTTDLQSILDMVNSLPEAGSGGGGGESELVTLTISNDGPSGIPRIVYYYVEYSDGVYTKTETEIYYEIEIEGEIVEDATTTTGEAVYFGIVDEVEETYYCVCEEVLFESQTNIYATNADGVFKITKPGTYNVLNNSMIFCNCSILSTTNLTTIYFSPPIKVLQVTGDATIKLSV